MTIRKPTRRELLKYGVKAGIVAFGVPTLLKLMERDAHAAVTYFGFGVNSTTGAATGTPSEDGGYNNITLWMQPSFLSEFAAYFTCPGTGPQNVVDISSYCRSTAGSPQLQCAVYDDAGTTLMARGTSAVSITGSVGFQGHQSAGVITQSSTLTGGNLYCFFHTLSGATSSVYTSDLNTNNAFGYELATYVGSIPAAVPTPTGNLRAYMCRIGVEPAGGGGGSATRHRVIQS